MLRLLIRGINPSIAAPLHVGTCDLATAEAKRSQFMAVLPPMILTIFAFIGGAHLAMDTTAGERERQSLEPPLATLVSRAALVGGKMLASVCLGLLSMLLILLVQRTATWSAAWAGRWTSAFAGDGQAVADPVPAGAGRVRADHRAGGGAKSMKEAQSHIMWLMMLPMLPAHGLMAIRSRTPSCGSTRCRSCRRTS